MNSTAIKHICFDKDGTIIDVHCYWAHICGIRAERLCQESGLSTDHADLISRAMGIDTASVKIRESGPVGYAPRSEVVMAAKSELAKLGVEFSTTKIDEVFRAVDNYQRETNDYLIRILPGVFDTLSELKDLGVRLSIYSSDRSFNSIRIMESLGLADCISAYAGGDTVAYSKPHPAGLIAMCKAVDCVPGESAYVGDTASDMIMASDAGSMGVGVLTGLDDCTKLEAEATIVLTDLTQLRAELF